MSEIQGVVARQSGNYRGLFFRILAFGVSSIFFSVYPLYIFVIYMAGNGFYAYEMPENFFSLRVFFLTTLITLAIVGGVLLFSLPGVISSYRKIDGVHWIKRCWKSAWGNKGFIFGNMLVWLLLGLMAFESKGVSFISALIVSFLLGLLFLLIIFASARTYLIALVIYVLAAFFHPLLDPRIASSLLEIGLKRFNVGGVDVELFDDGNLTSGKLVFLSPSYIYMRTENGKRLSIVPRTDAVLLRYSAKSEMPSDATPLNKDVLHDTAEQNPKP